MTNYKETYSKQVGAAFTKEQVEFIDSVAQELKCSYSEVLRKAVNEMYNNIQKIKDNVDDKMERLAALRDKTEEK